MKLWKQLGKKISQLVLGWNMRNTQQALLVEISNKMIVNPDVLHSGMNNWFSTHIGSTKIVTIDYYGSLRTTYNSWSKLQTPQISADDEAIARYSTFVDERAQLFDS